MCYEGRSVYERLFSSYSSGARSTALSASDSRLPPYLRTEALYTGIRVYLHDHFNACVEYVWRELERPYSSHRTHIKSLLTIAPASTCADRDCGANHQAIRTLMENTSGSAHDYCPPRIFLPLSYPMCSRGQQRQPYNASRLNDPDTHEKSHV